MPPILDYPPAGGQLGEEISIAVGEVSPTFTDGCTGRCHPFDIVSV
jgi:hypothetical protein